MAQQRSADPAALCWLAQQLEWERVLAEHRDARDAGPGRWVRRDRPAA